MVRMCGARLETTTYAVLDVDIRPLILHVLIYREEILDVLIGEFMELSIGNIRWFGVLETVGGWRPRKAFTS
jgi:hypothetical protein